MEWYLKVLRQFADFEGRAKRQEYWMFMLFNTIFLVIALILDNILGITFGRTIFYGPIYTLYALVVFIPGLAVSVRRLHDIGKSGWYYLILLIPLAGPIWFLVLMIRESDKAKNQYDLVHDDNNTLAQSEIYENSLLSFASNGKTKDILVLAIVIWMFVTEMFWVIIPRILENMNVILYETSWFRPLSLFMSIVWSFVPIVLALVVKDKTKQLILLIIGAVYLVVNLTGAITRFTQAY